MICEVPDPKFISKEQLSDYYEYRAHKIKALTDYHETQKNRNVSIKIYINKCLESCNEYFKNEEMKLLNFQK